MLESRSFVGVSRVVDGAHLDAALSELATLRAENARLRSRVEELENKTPLDRLTTFLETPIEEFEDEVPVCRCGAPSPDGVTCWKCLATQAESENARLREVMREVSCSIDRVLADWFDAEGTMKIVGEDDVNVVLRAWARTLDAALKEPGDLKS